MAKLMLAVLMRAKVQDMGHNKKNAAQAVKPADKDVLIGVVRMGNHRHEKENKKPNGAVYEDVLILVTAKSAV